jgi:hypothetical protein
MPFPEAPAARAIASQAGLPVDYLGSLSLGFGIFVREGQEERLDIWAHEFRHVAQCECLGGVRGFIRSHCLEIIHFGYGTGPLEIDAKHAELFV